MQRNHFRISLTYYVQFVWKRWESGSGGDKSPRGRSDHNYEETNVDDVRDGDEAMNGVDSTFSSSDGNMSSLDQFLVLVRKRFESEPSRNFLLRIHM